jgi:hypothetical protein
MTTQNTDISSWDTLYSVHQEWDNYGGRAVSGLWEFFIQPEELLWKFVCSIVFKLWQHCLELKLESLSVTASSAICPTDAVNFGTHYPCYMFPLIKQCKAIPVTGCGRLQGCNTSRLPHFLDNRLTDGGEVVSLTRWQTFTLRKIPSPRFVRGRVDPRIIVQHETLGQLKNQWPHRESEPATLRLVA